MQDRPRFTISITITDNQGYDCYTHAIGCDEALRISHRAVDDLKTGMLRAFSVDPMAETVTIMRTREMRRRLLMEAAQQLAGQMADRMEDAEGWHDPERIEPARKAIGGSWR
jgi:hypothetical protein